MLKAFGKALKFFVYEFIIFGVIYEFLVIIRLWPQNVSGFWFSIIWLVIICGQWWYFYRK